MASRCFILVALVSCVLIVSCDANYNKSSAAEVAQSSSSESYAQSSSEAQSQTTTKKKKKCRKVKKCSENEEFSYCLQSIGRAQYCSQNGLLVANRGACSTCTEGCVCKEDYLRNVNGTCIPARECEPQCAPSEVLDKCPVDCASDYCPISEEDAALTCSAPDEDDCPRPVCKCGFNSRRVDNGTCIPTRNCPPFDCSSRPNEEYKSCPALCPSDECSLPRVKGVCPFKIRSILNCKPKCQCKEGYGRSNGTCVPFEECPDLCPINEEYSSCTQSMCRSENCSTKNDPVRCVKIDPKYCKKGCVCKENYYRNANGTCVAADQCEAEAPIDCSSKPNEVYDPCPPYCPSDECSLPRVKGECPYKILVKLQCKPKCQCKDGYGRSNGTCVLFEECPDLCPINEEYNSCTQATCRAVNCSTRNDPVACVRIDPRYCNRGCVCKDNYYRNANGTCVEAEQCEADVCPINEEYNSCTQAICRAVNCSTRNDPVSCARIDPKYCKKGCVCKENYYRNANGACVAPDECEEKSCSANEEYVPCIQGVCRAMNCTQKDQDIPCPDRAWPPEQCDAGCICKEDYLRAANGSCVPKDQCDSPKCPNPNEEYTVSRTPKCPKLGTCMSLVAKIPCDKPEVGGCTCMGGYLRLNETSSCIPLCECPEMANSPDCQYTEE